MSADDQLTPLSVPDDVNNFWHFHNPESRTVVVFVHGILSNSRECWTAKTGVYWPTLLLHDTRVEPPSLYLGGYTTFAGSGDLRIHDCARELLDDLKLVDGSGRPSALSAASVVFVCHSTGGIVVRYMLERYSKEFAGKRLGLVLLASPTLGSEEANRLDALLSFYNQQLGKQLQTGNESLFDIDNRFRDVVHRKLLDLQGIEGYEHYFVIRNRLPRWLQQWAPNWGRRVVPAFSAGVYFGAPKLMPRTDHFTIVKPSTTAHPSHKLLVAFLTEFDGPSAVPLARHVSGPIADPAKQAHDSNHPTPILRPLPSHQSTELWGTLSRIRNEPDTEFSRELRAESTERSVVVRRPNAILTEVTRLVNISNQAQGSCTFGLFTDSPSQFKDIALQASGRIDTVEFEPSVSLQAAKSGLKFIVTLGFKGNIVKPGSRITLRYTAHFPSSVALNEDYWVFPAEKMPPDAEYDIKVKFPKAPADLACYRIALDDTREPIAISGPVREVLQDSTEELFVYRATPDNPGGNSFVMTWRLENER